MQVYRIGVRCRFLPIWKTHKVVGHTTEILGNTARLVLTLSSGFVLTVPRIDRKPVKVYPEYHATKKPVPLPSVE